MDPITAVSFAVAVAQAADIAAKTCKMIYRFQDRVGSAPADIVQLTLDLDTLRTLLVEVDAVTREIRDDENVSPELLTLWTRKERSLLQDLLSIQQLADRLVELLNGPTVTSLQLRARLRIACSEKTVSRFHESVFKHIEFLGMLHGLLNRPKLEALDRKAQKSNQTLDRLTTNISSLHSSIRDESDITRKFLAEEFQIIKSKLNDLVVPSMNSFNGRERCLVASHSRTELGTGFPEHAEIHSLTLRSHQHDLQSSVRTPMDLSRTQYKSLKSLSWRWTSYDLPIGILAIETIQSEVNPSNIRGRSTKEKNYTIKFRFAPSLWIMDRIVQVSYRFTISDYRLPYWQSEMSDELSLIPLDLEQSFQDGALIDFLDCMEAMPYSSIYEIITRNWDPRPWKTKARTTSSLFMDCRFYRASNLDAGRAVEMWFRPRHTYDDQNKRARLRFWQPSIPIEALDPQCLDFEGQTSRPCYQIIFDEAGLESEFIDRLFFPPPTICLPPNAVGVELFKNFVCPFIDPVHLAHIRDRDRWWLSALMHAEPGFEAALLAQLDSFHPNPWVGHQGNRSTYGLQKFAYLDSLQEIINGAPLERDIFVSWLSMLGNERMLQPLISAGLKLDFMLDLTLSYLSIAAQARNLDSFRVLLAAGARTRNSNDALAAFNGFARTPNDEFLIDGLLSATPHKFDNLPYTVPYLANYWLHDEVKGDPPNKYVAQRMVKYYHAHYSHPPYRREFYLGPEVLAAIYFHDCSFLEFLIGNKAGLESEKKGVNIAYLDHEHPTALEMAVVFGQPCCLKLLLEAEGYSDRIYHLKRARAASAIVIDREHPRYPPHDWKGGKTISLQVDMEMYDLILQTLHNAGCHEDHEGNRFRDATTLIKATEEMPMESPEEMKQRLRDYDSRVSKIRAGMIIHDAGRRDPRRRNLPRLPVPQPTKSEGNDAHAIMSSSTARPQRRRRGGRFYRYLERAEGAWHQLSTVHGALEALLVVVGIFLGLRAVATYYIWEMALWTSACLDRRRGR